MMHPTGSWRVRVGRTTAVLALCGVHRPARAQPVDAQASEERRTALYREGVDSATAGRWPDARDRFRQALAIRSSPKVLFSLGQSEERLGEVASAEADYNRALEGAKAAAEADVVSAAEHAAAAIAPRVPHVRVALMGQAGGREVRATLDGRAVTLGGEVAVDPGAHRLVVSSPGMREMTMSVAIGERQQLQVPVLLEVAAGTTGEPSDARVPAPPTERAQAPTGLAPWRTVGLVVAGAGVVGLGIGAVFGLEAKVKQDQSNSTGCIGDSCTASAAGTRRDAISAGNASTVAFAIGGALAAGGVVLWLVAPSKRGAGVRVAPLALGGGGGITVSGGWR